MPVTVINKTTGEVLSADNICAEGRQVRPDLSADRRQEIGDPIPKAPPVGMSRQPTMDERMKMIIRNQLADFAAAQEMETFEEADDFDVADDPPDPHTPYEAVFDPAVPKEPPRTQPAAPAADPQSPAPDPAKPPEPAPAVVPLPDPGKSA